MLVARRFVFLGMLPWLVVSKADLNSMTYGLPAGVSTWAPPTRVCAADIHRAKC